MGRRHGGLPLPSDDLTCRTLSRVGFLGCSCCLWASAWSVRAFCNELYRTTGCSGDTSTFACQAPHHSSSLVSSQMPNRTTASVSASRALARKSAVKSARGGVRRQKPISSMPSACFPWYLLNSSTSCQRLEDLQSLPGELRTLEGVGSMPMFGETHGLVTTS